MKRTATRAYDRHHFVRMGDTGVAGELILGQQADDLRGRSARLSDGVGDILGALARAGEVNARGRAFDGTQLGVRLARKMWCGINKV